MVPLGLVLSDEDGDGGDIEVGDCLTVWWCGRAAFKDLIKNSFYVGRYYSSMRERTIICPVSM